ncbi:hypothetical protein F5146DRAFT_1138934 [Armillaria mellea]|nr:hypothetical protein F5146DRAFT_1138934 [Armillaria mellea]
MTIIFKLRKKPGHKGKGLPSVNLRWIGNIKLAVSVLRLCRATTAAAVWSFPPILLLKSPSICILMSLEGGQVALASLTLVSRRVHEAVDRELYSAPRLTSIMQWVQFLEALRRTGEPDIERRVRRLYLTGPKFGFRHRFATRDAVFAPLAIDILKGCTNAKQVTVTYRPRLMPVIDAARNLRHITSLCVIGSTLFGEAFFGENALVEIFLNPTYPSSFPSVTSLTLVRCSYNPGYRDHRMVNGHHTLHLQSLRIIDANLCGTTFAFLVRPCLATLTILVLSFGGEPGHDMDERTFKGQLQSLTHLRHLAIIGWNRDHHPYEWSRGLLDDVVTNLPHLDTLSFCSHLATLRIFTVMTQLARTMEAAQHPRAYLHNPASAATSRVSTDRDSRS